MIYKTLLKTFSIPRNIRAHHLLNRFLSRESPTVLNLYTTQVPKEMEGKGIAKLLAKEAFEYCKDNQMGMRLTCWYLDGYLKRNPSEEYQKLVVQ